MAFGVYIHWPFCKSKCPYCDFNSHVAERIDHAMWTDAYLRDIEHWAALTPGRQVDTVFFGGGTPSLMPPETVHAILDKIQRCWTIANDWEVTLEANPTSVEEQKFAGFRAAGVNRVSMGIQSLNDDDLKFLGRTHSATEAQHAIETARKTFDRYSFDLIYARPQQTLTAWSDELGRALALAGGHLSLYQLTIEKQTPFFAQHARGEFKIPDQDAAADLYDVTQEIMEAAGYPAYEVSNHAQPGQESRHNLIYWRYGDYAGIGPGAHGRVSLPGKKLATRAHRAPDIWLKKMMEQGSALHPHEEVGPVARLQEALMMGLRLREGVPYFRLALEYAGNPDEVINPDRVQRLKEEGLLIDQKETLQTTPQGLKCLNAVLGYLLGAG